MTPHQYHAALVAAGFAGGLFAGFWCGWFALWALMSRRDDED